MKIPVIDLGGTDPEEHDRILDAASLQEDWMLAVHSPGKETFHIVCLSFEDSPVSDFLALLRRFCIAPADTAVLAKLYAADFAVYKSGTEIMGTTARAFRVHATQVINIKPPSLLCLLDQARKDIPCRPVT